MLVTEGAKFTVSDYPDSTVHTLNIVLNVSNISKIELIKLKKRKQFVF